MIVVHLIYMILAFPNYEISCLAKAVLFQPVSVWYHHDTDSGYFQNTFMLSTNKDPTVWLDGAKPHTKYVFKNNITLPNSKI